MANPRDHIEEIRTRKFSIGGEENPLTVDLYEAVKHLSAELYSKDVHFLMELIQNAEDNDYPSNVEPMLEFLITTEDLTAVGAPATLLVFNNEKGFSKRNIDSICSVGRSTKKGKRQGGYIGEKGIGFKSVFLVTSQPYIFSNGYQIRFNEIPPTGVSMGYIVPEWVDEKPTIEELRQVYGSTLPSTTIVLPLRCEKVEAVKQQLAIMHPEVILFMSKIKNLRVREDNHQKPESSRLNTISVSRETDLSSMKNDDSESFTLHLSAQENENKTKECSYYMWRQRFNVKPESRVEQRKEMEKWVITLAFPFHERLARAGSTAADAGVYAFLPTEMITKLPFLIQADFLLVSSRETIVLDSKWNVGILDCVPSAFCAAFISLLRQVESAPLASRAHIFKYLPIDRPPYPQLLRVRTAIQSQLKTEDIMYCETWSSKQKAPVCKPTEARRILPTFRKILEKARECGLSAPGGWGSSRILHSCFEQVTFSDILEFFGVEYVSCDWYSRCIQSPGWVTQLPDDLYVELLWFLAENWYKSEFSYNLWSAPVIKYVTYPDNGVALASLRDMKNGCHRIYMSSRDAHISWLTQWTRELGCVSRYSIPDGTQAALHKLPGYRADRVKDWLNRDANITELSVSTFAEQLLKGAQSSRNAEFVIKVAHFLHYSLENGYGIDPLTVDRLREKLPIVDKSGSVLKKNGRAILLPASISQWPKLMGRDQLSVPGFVVLSEDYLTPPPCVGRLEGEQKNLVSFMGTHFGAADIPRVIPPSDSFSIVSTPLPSDNAFLLLEWIEYLENNLPDKFKASIAEGKWLRTRYGYESPRRSFLFDIKSWGAALQLSDAPFIDDTYYGQKIYKFKDALRRIGVVTECGEGCDIIVEILKTHKDIQAITRLYQYLHRFGWKPGSNNNPVKIWIPGCDESNVAGEWVHGKFCVIHDDNGLFESRLKVLQNYYDDALLLFFSRVLGVAPNPRIEDYCNLWLDWTSKPQRHQITQAECCLVWKNVVKHWGSSSSKIKQYLNGSPESLRLPIITEAGVIGLSGLNETFVPDDLHLKELFLKKASTRPKFTWHPNRSAPEIPLDSLFSIYNQLGVRNISQSVQKVEVYAPTSGMCLLKIVSGHGMVGEGLCRMVLGYLSNPSFKLVPDERHRILRILVESSVYESPVPFTVEYSLSLPDHQQVRVRTATMARWDKGSNTILLAKSGNMGNMAFAIDFAQVISDGLLSEHPDLVPGLSEMVRLGSLVGFDVEAVNVLLRMRNLQLFMEDDDFLSSIFPGKPEDCVGRSIPSGVGRHHFGGNRSLGAVSAETAVRVGHCSAENDGDKRFEGWDKSLSIIKQFASNPADTTTTCLNKLVRRLFQLTATEELLSDDSVDLRLLKVLGDAYLKVMVIWKALPGSHETSSVTLPLLEVANLLDGPNSQQSRDREVNVLGLNKYFVGKDTGVEQSASSALPHGDGVIEAILGAQILGFYCGAMERVHGDG